MPSRLNYLSVTFQEDVMMGPALFATGSTVSLPESVARGLGNQVTINGPGSAASAPTMGGSGLLDANGAKFANLAALTAAYPPASVLASSTLARVAYTADGKKYDALIVGGVAVWFDATSGFKLRQVSTNCKAMNTLNVGSTQTQTRSSHWMRANAPTLQVTYPNWYADYALGEHNSGAAATLECALEYPAGIFTRMTQGGQNVATAVNGGDFVFDPVAAPLKGAQYWLRPFFTCSAGILYLGIGTPTYSGDSFNYGTGIANQVMGGTIVNAVGGFFAYLPTSIVGLSSQRAIGGVGDSRLLGQLDTASGVTNDIGEVSRSLSGLVPTIILGIPSESAWKATGEGANNLTRVAKRVAILLAYTDAVIVQYGINDVNLQARSAANTYPLLQILWGAFKGVMPVLQTTMPPVSSSTDGYVTTANQTTGASNTERVKLNNMIRQSVDVSGVVEIADVLESARDSGLWKAFNPAITSDGLHELVNGNALIVSSGALHPGRFFG